MILSQTQGATSEIKAENNGQAQNNVSASTNVHEIKQVKIKSEKLNLNYEVFIENESMLSQQRCYIMTVHDIGFDYTQYQPFVHCEKMTGIRNRVVWLHVNLPGQEPEATDLTIKKYPSFNELAEELVCILDYLKIPQVVVMGEGAGASISAQFAIKHPNRCLGTVLIEPVASTATVLDSIKYKLNNLNPFASKVKQQENLSYIFNRFERKRSLSISGSSENEALQNESDLKISESNQKNLSLFAESYLNRPSILEKLKDLRVDTLVAVGKNSCSYSEARKFYRAIEENRRDSLAKMVNTPFVEIDNITNVLHDSPDRLAVSFQYFLQGIGLLSALPMKNIVRKQSTSTSSYGRSLSMEEADRPNSSSPSDSNSQNESSNQSLNNE